MSKPRLPTHPSDDPTLVKYMERALERFSAASSESSDGEDQPSLETFLDDIPEPARGTLIRFLSATHQGQRLTRNDRDGRAQAPAGDDQVSSVTLDFAAPVPPGQEPTLVREGLASDADLQSLPEDAAAPPGRGGAPTGAPTMVPGYEVLGKLGQGGMGVVYKARHVKLDRLVALKMVLGGGHGDMDHRGRFQTESQAVAHLQHPNIVQIYEVGELAGLPYLSLEYVSGGSLAQKTGGQPQPPREAAHLVETLARAVAFAHERGIVHRDLKPSNILLTADGAPKVTDFGLAKRLEDDSSQTRTGTIMGSPSYMAPEQARGENHRIGPPADVHALGAILYELLTGRPPYRAGTPMETVQQVINREPVPPSRLTPRLPRDLETICLRCLQKEEARRYASALELADDLQRFQANEPIKARRTTALERLWRWAKRNPGVAALSAAVLLLCVAITVTSVVSALRIDHERGLAVEAKFQAEASAAEALEARDSARRALLQADVNAALAHQQAGLALETLSDLLTSVRASLKDTPGTQRLREALARQVLDNLGRIAASVERTPLAGFSKAEAHRFLGTIYLELGKAKEARPHFEQCHAILARLAQGEVAGARGQRNLTVALCALGDFNLLTGDRAGAGGHYQKALRLRRELLDADPGSGARVDLATALVKAGNASEPGPAREYYAEALTLRQELEESAVESAPARDLAARRRDVWIVHNLLGDLSLRQRQPAAALEHYRRGLALAEKLAEPNPRNPTGRQALAVSYEKLGDAHSRAGEAEPARDFFSRALELYRPLVNEDPENLALQASLAILMARSGAHEEATRQATVMNKLAPAYANNVYNVACCLALCVAAVAPGKADDQLTPAERDLRQRYAVSALKMLERAVNLGFSNLNLMRTDPDLEPVRGHPKFEALLKKAVSGQQSAVRKAL